MKFTTAGATASATSKSNNTYHLEYNNMCGVTSPLAGGAPENQLYCSLSQNKAREQILEFPTYFCFFSGVNEILLDSAKT